MSESTSTFKTNGEAIYKESVIVIAKTKRTGEYKEGGTTEPLGKHKKDKPQQVSSEGTPTEPRSNHSRIEISESDDSEDEEDQDIQMHWQQKNREERWEIEKEYFQDKRAYVTSKKARSGKLLNLALKRAIKNNGRPKSLNPKTQEQVVLKKTGKKVTTQEARRNKAARAARKDTTNSEETVSENSK